MKLVDKIFGIFGFTVAMLGVVVFAFWMIVLPSIQVLGFLVLIIAHALMWFLLLPEFGLRQRKSKSETI